MRAEAATAVKTHFSADCILSGARVAFDSPDSSMRTIICTLAFFRGLGTAPIRVGASGPRIFITQRNRRCATCSIFPRRRGFGGGPFTTHLRE
jgi:hypothetical protein